MATTQSIRIRVLAIVYLALTWGLCAYTLLLINGAR